MLNYDVTFNLGSAKVSSPTIFETNFLFTKIYGLLQLIVKRPVRALICFHASSTDRRRRIMVSLE